MLERAWEIDPQVALRPERFGALAYHFGTRRLSFLKTPKLTAAVQTLGTHTSARAALVAAGVDEPELPAYGRALQTLADGGMICERGA